MASTSASTSSAPPPVVIPGSGNNIIVNHVQAKNPVLECIRNVGKEFGDILADFQVGRTTGLLYLSLKYHRIHPEYIHNRIEKLGHSYNLRILLILCDVTEHKDSIKELTKACLVNNVTIIVAFSLDEAGHYISTFKQFEYKSPDLIKERTEKDYHSLLRAALTSIPKVNKTDVETLRSSFGSFAKISHATSDQLQNLPGFGQVKVKNLKNAFEKPFRNNATSALASSQAPSGTQRPPATGSTSGPSAGAPSSSTEAEEPPRPARAPRPPSPEWDIELDLDMPEDDDAGPPPRPALTAPASPGPRAPPAPRPIIGREDSEASLNSQQQEFDIDLYLN